MAAPAENLPLVTVEKLDIHQTHGVLTLENAQEGIQHFNDDCPGKTMPLSELLNVMLVAQGFGATDLTADFQLDQQAPNIKWSLTAVSHQHAPTRNVVLFRGVEVELDRCSERTRRLIEMALRNGTHTPNPFADLEALEESTTAKAVSQLAATMLASHTPAVDIEDALAELRAHMDEHFLQRKLVRLYER
ncbi:hypothetical protein ACQKD0_13175 [Vreelandella aquamarina]|uniref:hypothetical protein n=1 Tax=Vreelandella aquamarina TaxID=77097 RepID=UPI003D01367D